MLASSKFGTETPTKRQIIAITGDSFAAPPLLLPVMSHIRSEDDGALLSQNGP